MASAGIALTRAAIATAVVYRGRLVIGFLTSFFPLLLMAVWLTVVAGNGPPRAVGRHRTSLPTTRPRRSCGT